MIPWYPQQCGRCNELTNGMTVVGDVGASSTVFLERNQAKVVVIGLISFRVHNSIGCGECSLITEIGNAFFTPCFCLFR